MKKNKIPNNCNILDYVQMKKYQKSKPAIINAYYKTNLLAFIDKLPDDEMPWDSQIQSSSQQQSSSEVSQQLLGIKNAVRAVKHQYDRMGDIEVNQYSITKFILGKGSHCFVKLAKKDGQTFAIKIISLDKIRKRYYIRQQTLTNMINMEIIFLQKLKHQHIIQFHQAICSVQKQRIFLIMENCQKGSLLKVINSSLTVPLQQWMKSVKKYCLQTLRGLQHIHLNNIIHRDIKSQNILVDQNDDIKIIDFNISAEVPPSGKITLKGKFAGTKTYAPPQLLIRQKSQKIVDGRLIDVWALGVTIYQLIQRRHPFAKCISQQDLIREIQQPIIFPKTYDQNLRNFLSSMLKFENSQRSAVKKLLNHPWLQGVKNANMRNNKMENRV